MTTHPTTCDLLLTGGTVVTMDDERRVIDQGAVAITGQRIAAVGTTAELNTYVAQRTIQCHGQAVIPGLIDCHQHLFQYLMRGLGEGMELWPWLSEFMWPICTNIDRDDAAIAASLSAVEAARAGVTAVTDNHYAPTDYDTTLAVVDAIAKVGLRGAVARGMFGPETEVARKGGLAGPLFGRSVEEELEITRAAIEARPPTERVTVWPAPENIIYVEQDLVRRSAALAREFGVGWHSHCSEVSSDPEIYLEAYGVRPADWLYDEGLLGDGATLAHGIFFDDREISRLGSTRTGVAYCPLSHQYSALGVMRLRDLRDSGAIIGLGADGGSSYHLDLFENMRQAVYLQRVTTREPTVSNGEEALELATRGGAEYMRIDAGILAPGKLADVVVVDLQRPHLRPLHRVVPTLVYSASGSDVVMTIVDGTVIYEDDSCTLVDETAVVEEAQARADLLAERSGTDRLRTPWRHSIGPAGRA